MMVLNNPAQHHCMQCGEPMHSNLCSKLYCDHIIDDNSPININKKDLSERACGLMSNASALMCFTCINKLNKAPSAAAASPAGTVAAVTSAVATVTPQVSLNLLASATNRLGTATRPSSKPQDDFLYSQFIITPISGVGGGPTKYNVKCKHCNMFTKYGIKAFNANRAQTHITGPCKGVGPDVKVHAKRGFQSHKCKRNDLALMSSPTETAAAMGQRLSSQAVVDMERDGLEIIVASQKKKKVPTLQSTLQQAYGDAMTTADAKYVLTVEVHVMVTRGETMSHLLGPWVQAGIILCYPATGKFLHLTITTIYDQYVVAIDEATTEELKTFVQKIPGHINISMDGVTVNRKQKIVYTLMRGDFTIFLKWTDDSFHANLSR
eukprot:7002289-Ditylum_brightwellii.AAC.1